MCKYNREGRDICGGCTEYWGRGAIIVGLDTEICGIEACGLFSQSI